MKAEHKSVIRATWATIQPHTELLMANFYAELFEMEPEARVMFAHVDMRAQHRKFIDMLDALVRMLDDPEDIVTETIPTARRHATYGVGDQHLEAGRQALLHAFEETLGDEFTPTARRAWGELYDLTAAVIHRAAERSARVRSA